MVSLTTARPCGWNVAPSRRRGGEGRAPGRRSAASAPPPLFVASRPLRRRPASSHSALPSLQPRCRSVAGTHSPPLPRRQVKKVGEPCTLYCKGRILGYKRRAAPALRAWGGVASGAAAWLGLRGRAA